MPNQIVTKCDASGKNGKLSCCQCTFDWIKANLAEIQPENRQNVQKTRFLQKAPGVNGLRKHATGWVEITKLGRCTEEFNLFHPLWFHAYSTGKLQLYISSSLLIFIHY